MSNTKFKLGLQFHAPGNTPIITFLEKVVVVSEKRKDEGKSQISISEGGLTITLLEFISN